MNSILLIILVIIIFDYLFDLTLDILNLKSRSNPVPDLLADVYPPERYSLQQEYESETTQFNLIHSTLSIIVLFVVLYFGWLGKLHEWLITFNLFDIITTLIFFAILGIIGWIGSLPFSLWGTFVIEAKYGFNRTTPRLFVTDSIKSILISAIIGGSLIALITWLFYAAGNWFWIVALGVMLTFSLLANALYSRVIVPLFNKQKPLQEGELLNKIKEFGASVGFPVSKVYVIDGSKRSTKANAYFSGFGRNRRVVLYDTLMEKMSNGEILAVLAHEIGHYRKRHIWVNFCIGALQSAVILFIFSRIAQSVELSIALGYHNATAPVFHLSLLAFGLLFSPIESILGLITNSISRKMEFQADDFATSSGFGPELVSGLKKLSSENLSNLTPHPAYVFVNYSHHTLLSRVKKILLH